MIYDYPQYYEAAFSFRDIPREASFLQKCIERYSDIEVRWLFEVACGPAPHVAELGKLGYLYLGLDNNRNMLDYAVHKWKDISPRPEFLEGDMVSFETPRPIDFAYVMLGSLYVNTIEEMTSHFDSVACALRSGGLYLLDWCVQFEDPLKYSGGNTVTYEQDGITVESKFDIRLVDASRQMYEEVWTLEVNDRSRRRRLQMFERNRAIFPKDFLTFIQNRTDFEFIGWWKDWDLSHPITEATNVTRPVALIRRK